MGGHRRTGGTGGAGPGNRILETNGCRLPRRVLGQETDRETNRSDSETGGASLLPRTQVQGHERPAQGAVGTVAALSCTCLESGRHREGKDGDLTGTGGHGCGPMVGLGSGGESPRGGQEQKGRNRDW